LFYVTYKKKLPYNSLQIAIFCPFTHPSFIWF